MSLWINASGPSHHGKRDSLDASNVDGVVRLPEPDQVSRVDVLSVVAQGPVFAALLPHLLREEQDVGPVVLDNAQAEPPSLRGFGARRTPGRCPRSPPTTVVPCSSHARTMPRAAGSRPVPGLAFQKGARAQCQAPRMVAFAQPWVTAGLGHLLKIGVGRRRGRNETFLDVAHHHNVEPEGRLPRLEGGARQVLEPCTPPPNKLQHS